MIKVFSNQFVVFKTGLTSFLFGFLFLAFFYTAPAQTYSWSNVAMGGGGFVSGIITSKTEANVMYARTDVGGAYRWDNANGKWIPLLDWNSTSQTGYQGVESIALDPSTAGRVYMLVGTSYFNSGQTAILKSNDYGSTFTTTVITSQFQAHGNGMGRQAGERLAVDPNNPNILFCGTRLDGLWKSTNAGSTWSRVWTGSSGTDIVNDNGVCFVVFDPSSVSSGITQNIYIGVCRTGSANIYKSTDAGASFTAISATTSLMPQRAALSGTTMYVTHSDSEGPWGPTSGAVYKLNTSTGAWTNVTPATGRAYCGVSVSPTDPTRVIVSTTNFYNINQYSSVWGDAIYLSTNGGTGWTLKSSGITLNDNGAGWIVGQSIHWAGSIEFDPSNTAKAWVGSGNGIFSCDNVDAASTTLKFNVKGLEETVPLDAASIAGGPLISAIGDFDGFIHSDITVYPSNRHQTPMGTTTGIAYAAGSTSKLLRVGSAMYYSTNQGSSWTACNLPGSGLDFGKVAISANGNTFLHSPDGSNNTYYSTDNGANWTSTGLSINTAFPVADMVNSSKFYVYNNSTGAMWVSTNGGVSFAASGSPGTGGAKRIQTVPGNEGHIWIAMYSGGLKRSINSGAAFTTPNTAVTYCGAVGLGKAEPSATYPTVYIWGTVSGVLGIHRSIDQGATWTRINDDAHEWGGPGNGEFVIGDWNTYGRVYMSSVGRGIVYGEISGPLPLSANAGSDVSICLGNSTTLSGSGSGGTSPYTYSWSPTTGLSSSTIYNPVATPTSTTTYTLTVKDAVNATATDAVTVTVNSLQSLPITEGFESATFPSTGWTQTGTDNFVRNTTTCTNATGTGSMEAVTFGNSSIGNTYELTTPYLSLPTATSTTLTFKYATMFYNVGGSANDRYDDLSVYISTGCGGAYTSIWTQSTDGVTNTTASTAGNTSFCPGSSANDWDSETVDLSAYDGGTSGTGVRIKFVVTNGNGSNVYLDDINISNVGSSSTPVTLLNFEGDFDENQAVKLNWNVTYETDMKGYKLLRAVNLAQEIWEEIGFVSSLNSGSDLQSYSYDDYNLPSVSTVYYKLVTVESNGKTSESRIISLNRDETDFSLTVYPNPTDHSFNVTIKDDKNTSHLLQVYDIVGGIIEEINMPSGISILSIGESFRPGIYFLKIKGSVQKTIKLIKQ